MRSQLRIVLITLVLAGAWAVGGKISGVVADMETFRVREVEVVGANFIDQGAVLELLKLESDATVWGDTREWAQRVQAHPMVQTVRIKRRIPGTLVVDVRERVPVALAPTPTLEPVDAEGQRLPVDPAEHALDLPVIGSDAPVPGARYLPARGRQLAGEVARLMEADTAFLQRVSEVWWVDRDCLRVRWSQPRVDFLLASDTPASAATA